MERRPCVSFLLVLLLFLGTLSKADERNAIDLSTSSGSNSTVNDLHAHIHEDQNDTFVFNVSALEVSLQESLFFVRKIFLQYGDETFLSKHNLEDILKNVGLFATIEKDHEHSEDEHTLGEHEHSNEEHFHGAHEHSKDEHSLGEHKHSSHEHALGEHEHSSDKHSLGEHNHSDAGPTQTTEGLDRQRKSLERDHVHSSHNKCLRLSRLLEAFHMDSNQKFTQGDFTYLCPAFIQQLTVNDCSSGSNHVHSQSEQKDGTFDLSKIPARVWGFSTIAVVIISLAGLLGVAVIPIMQKVFYNHLLQFLVALAIGALSGDALLHLLPHAFAGTIEGSHSHGSEEDTEAAHVATAWKGLMALGGILFFFITERLLTILTSIKHRKKSRKLGNKKHCVKYCDVESNEKESVAGKLSGHHGNEDNCDKMVMLVHPNKDESVNDNKGMALKSFADATHDEFLHQCDEEQVMMGGDKKSPLGDEPDLELVEGSTNGVIESHSNLGHSHGGHSHGPVPNSVSAVAWMVILGDGIHNFSDGLAIGASFANSITGGLSTSVAVFCHELPHEIGDFAVLLRAGMSAKQAALYNCLSSLLCFIGMLIGVSIGNISSASLWVFAIVGGMFLYISLVDMLPEMTTVDPKKGENPFLHLMLQVLGILFGSSIMLLIALYEHDIKKSFG